MLSHLFLHIPIKTCTVRTVNRLCYFFLLQVSEAIDNHDGSFCAELLSFKHPHVANPRLQVRLSPPRYDEKSMMLLGYGLICMCLSAGQSRGKVSATSWATIRWDGCSSPQVIEPNSQSADAQTAEKPIRAQPVLRHGATCVFSKVIYIHCDYNLHSEWNKGNPSNGIARPLYVTGAPMQWPITTLSKPTSSRRSLSNILNDRYVCSHTQTHTCTHSTAKINCQQSVDVAPWPLTSFLRAFQSQKEENWWVHTDTHSCRRLVTVSENTSFVCVFSGRCPWCSPSLWISGFLPTM